MKKVIHFYVILFLCCHFESFAQQKIFVSNDVFQTQNFIENRGQFNAILKDSSEIDFAVNHGNDEIYLNKHGFKYHVVKLTPHKMTAKEKQEMREEENEENAEKEAKERLKYDKEEDWFLLEWLGINEHAEKQHAQKSNHYFTYGDEGYNSFGYKVIGYKNIYDGIDIKYELHKKGGVKYSLILGSNADINDIKFKYSSQKGVKISNEKNRLVIENKIGKLIESEIKAYYTDGQEVHLQYELDKDNVVHFISKDKLLPNRELIIDPWITANTSLTGVLSCINMAYDVDYDLAGNLIVIGGGGDYGFGNINLPKIAKYDNLGNLVWTFSGIVLVPSWISSPLHPRVGNFVIDKISNKIYISQGLNLGAGSVVVRLGTNGNYDNFISTQNVLFEEIWDMKFNCTNGKLIGMGGGTNSNLNFGVIDTTTGAVSTTNITGNTSYFQDIISACIDDNGEVFTILASSASTAVNNMIYKLNSNYTSNIWNVPSGYNDFEELQNKDFSGVTYFSNGFNALSVNTNYLFYYDGTHVKAFNKSTGAAVGTPFTITAHATKEQGGIYANNCNEVYVGGNNGNILKYFFNGSTFVLQNTIAINGYTGKSVYDIVYNSLNNSLYACGNGFVAVLDPQSSCPVASAAANIQLSYALHCPDSALVTILNPDPTISYTFIWIDSTANNTIQTSTIPPGMSSHGVSGLTPGHTIQVTVLKSSACQVLSSDTSFAINCNGSFVNIYKCPGDTIMLSNNIIISTPGTYTDTFTNVFNQDSVVYVNFNNYPTFAINNPVSICAGESYTLPNNTIVNTAGTYVSSLNTIHGCDSIITTILSINPVYSGIVYDTICSNQSYTLPSNVVVSVGGTYIDSLVGVSGCDSIITTHLTVNPSQTVHLYPTICGSSYVMPDNSVATSSGTYTFLFQNQYNCDSTIIVHLNFLQNINVTVNSYLCNQTSHVLPNGVLVTANGNYISNLTSSNGCDSIVTYHVEFNVTQYAQKNVSICENETYTLPDNSIVSTAGSYTSIISTTKGCDSIITTNIKVTLLPKVNLGRDTMLCENIPITLNATNTNVTYRWYDNSSYPTKTISGIGIYYVDVTRHPCAPVRDSIEILPCPCNIFIPNAFSPNNDNKNDVFKPRIQCAISTEDYSFQIFNRWGEVIFDTFLYDEGWDGTYLEVEQSIGTYMYLIKYKDPFTGKNELFKGDVTLIR